MRVVVCCKAVPIELPLESIATVNGDFQFKGVDFYINECDAYALEAALYLKNTYKAETVALTLGPLRSQEVLYIALAKGIDQVLRIDGETSRPELIASGLMATLKELKPQLILAGAQSEDWMGGEVGVYLSAGLDMGLAFGVIEICDLNDTHVRIKKEVGGGRRAEVLLKLPSILCVQTGIQPLKYLSTMKRQKARNSPIKLSGKYDLEQAKQTVGDMAAYEIREAFAPSKEGHAEMITGDRSEMVAKFMEIISKLH